MRSKGWVTSVETTPPVNPATKCSYLRRERNECGKSLFLNSSSVVAVILLTATKGLNCKLTPKVKGEPSEWWLILLRTTLWGRTRKASWSWFWLEILEVLVQSLPEQTCQSQNQKEKGEKEGEVETTSIQCQWWLSQVQPPMAPFIRILLHRPWLWDPRSLRLLTRSSKSNCQCHEWEQSWRQMSSLHKTHLWLVRIPS